MFIISSMFDTGAFITNLNHTGTNLTSWFVKNSHEHDSIEFDSHYDCRAIVTNVKKKMQFLKIPHLIFDHS